MNAVMSIARIIAIIIVFLVACGGWTILGVATMVRSDQFSEDLGDKVAAQWGKPLMQAPPRFKIGKDSELLPETSHITVALTRDYRKKGLVWYPTYLCRFAGEYRLGNAGKNECGVQMNFDFPNPGATYEDFSLTVDGQPVTTAVDPKTGIETEMMLAPGQKCTVHISYATRGLGSWSYHLGGEAGRVRGLELVLTTDFADFDYPDGTWTATEAKTDAGGAHLTWRSGDLITRQDVGVIVPDKVNPGPVASRIIFFAPVCLLFFFVLVAAIAVVRGINVHPMHYLFIAAGFFAFHLLLAYLVDHLDLQLAFAIAAVVAVALVTSYLSAALRSQLPVLVAVGGQVFFLVLFSYSFLFKGFTGLTVSIGAVATLAVLMRVTAGLDWKQVFTRKPLT